MKKTKKDEKIEIARSFSYKHNCGNFQSADFFCSAKKEVKEKEAEKESEALYLYCKKEVVKCLNEFKKNGLHEELDVSVEPTWNPLKRQSEYEEEKKEAMTNNLFKSKSENNL